MGFSYNINLEHVSSMTNSVCEKFDCSGHLTSDATPPRKPINYPENNYHF